MTISRGVAAADAVDVATAAGFRRAMSRLPTGVTLLTTVRAGQPEVMTANAVMSVSLEPLLLVASVATQSRWRLAAQAHGSFAVNVLAEHHEPLSRWGASPERHAATDPLGAWSAVESARTGCALLADAVARFDCTLEAEHIAGDHVLMVGRVVDLHSSELSRPLVFHASSYAGLGPCAAQPAAPLGIAVG